MQQTFIVDGCRTAIGSLKGSLSGIRTDDLAAHVLRKLIDKSSFPASMIDEVILGCANQAGEDNRNITRMALLLAGLPYAIPGETVNRLCASGMSAIVQAGRMIAVGDARAVIAGGVEHMTRAPWVISKSSTAFGNDSQMFDTSFGWRFINPKMRQLYGVDSMGETAENLAGLYSISREDQDIFAFHSQQKAALASKSGRLKMEICDIEVPVGKKESKLFSEDEFIKPYTSLETLATLRPAFRSEGGTVTAGNASGLNDGASAVLLASERMVDELHLSPLCRIVSSGVSGVEPRYMGIGPVEASKKALSKAGLLLSQIDIIEINEAFAVQVLACLRLLGIDDHDPRVNPNGGAIALGHPLGMSGSRILYSAAVELVLQKKKYALVTMCIGVGQGYAVVLENAQLS